MNDITRPSINSIIDHPLFQKSELARIFAEQPIGVVDVGARGGAHPLFDPLAKIVNVLGFEPDEHECRKLMDDPAISEKWANFKLKPFALGMQRETRNLHLMSLPTNHSLYPPNINFVERYKPKGMRLTETELVNVYPLDQVIPQGDEGNNGHVCEIIKLDTQGSELEILKGAEKTLRHQTVAIISEVEFCEVYDGQPLFSDVANYLKSIGFAHYGFLEIHNRSQKRLNKRYEAGRERIHWADAVFFKDPFDSSLTETLNDRDLYVLFISLLVLKYFDFALEVAELIWGETKECADMVSFVRSLAALPFEQQCVSVENLTEEIRRNPDDANILIGRFVDQRRTLCDYFDVI